MLPRTGATRVFPFSHIIRLERWEDGAEVAKEKADQDSVPLKTPARFVHVDHSYVGAPTVLHDNMTPEDAETLSKTRWGIINIWRPVNHAVTRDPLAICDAQSVAEKDLVGVWADIQGSTRRSVRGCISRGGL